jgi:hemolysin III
MKWFREPVNGLTHLAAALLALVGLVVLLIAGWGQPGKVFSLAVYGVSLILLFLASAIYHLVRARPAILQGLRKVDHSAIYLLIAGTYTPICFNLLTGFWSWGMLAIVWSLALVGIGIKIFYINAPRWVSAGVYLAMGWLCVLGARQMLAVLPAGLLLWMLIGGLTYTVGAIVYATKRPDFFPGVFGFHELWHIFVILGAMAHYIAVLRYVAVPG